LLQYGTAPDITQPFLLVCEGFGDGEFFRHLCAERQITGFQIENLTSHQKGQPSGNGGFRRYLQGLSGRKGSPKAVLIVSDSDEEPDKNFDEIKRQIKKANLLAPDNPLEVKRQSAGPALVVMMLPPHEVGQSAKGSLETLLLASISHSLPTVASCAEIYRTCVGAADWPTTKADKMKLRAMIAGHWKADPNISLGYALSPPNGIIPLGHGCFDATADFLRNFEQWLDSYGVR